MSRLLARAALVAGMAAVALTQLENEQELVVWELLLLGIVIWEMRSIPGAIGVDDPPLFDLSSEEPRRLPRSVAATELGVVDALSGHLGPERRLQPILKDIAVHRLRRHGVVFDSAAAVLALGEPAWSWLADPAKETPSSETIEAVVSSLERL